METDQLPRVRSSNRTSGPIPKSQLALLLLSADRGFAAPCWRVLARHARACVLVLACTHAHDLAGSLLSPAQFLKSLFRQNLGNLRAPWRRRPGPPPRPPRSKSSAHACSPSPTRRREESSTACWPSVKAHVPQLLDMVQLASGRPPHTPAARRRALRRVRGGSPPRSPRDDSSTTRAGQPTTWCADEAHTHAPWPLLGGARTRRRRRVQGPALRLLPLRRRQPLPQQRRHQLPLPRLHRLRRSRRRCSSAPLPQPLPHRRRWSRRCRSRASPPTRRQPPRPLPHRPRRSSRHRSRSTPTRRT